MIRLALVVAMISLLVLGVMYLSYRWAVHRSEMAERERQREYELDRHIDEQLFGDDALDRELEKERNR